MDTAQTSFPILDDVQNYFRGLVDDVLFFTLQTLPRRDATLQAHRYSIVILNTCSDELHFSVPAVQSFKVSIHQATPTESKYPIFLPYSNYKEDFFSFLENVYLVENTPALIIEYYDINIFIEKSILIYPSLSILSGILHCTERTLFKKNKKNANYNQLECLGEWFMTLLSLDLLWKSSL